MLTIWYVAPPNHRHVTGFTKLILDLAPHAIFSLLSCQIDMFRRSLEYPDVAIYNGQILDAASILSLQLSPRPRSELGFFFSDTLGMVAAASQWLLTRMLAQRTCHLF
jgi:hypothetical protein